MLARIDDYTFISLLYVCIIFMYSFILYTIYLFAFNIRMIRQYFSLTDILQLFSILLFVTDYQCIYYME